MLLFVVGTLEATSMIFLKQSLTIAAYEGARAAAVAGATSADAIAQAGQILNDRNVQGGTTTVTPDVATAATETFVAVTVTAPCAANSLFIGNLFAYQNLSATVEIMKEY